MLERCYPERISDHQYKIVGIQAKMDQAGKQGITDPAAGNNLWAQVDKEVTDQAPWVAMYNPKFIDFLGSRVKGLPNSARSGTS